MMKRIVTIMLLMLTAIGMQAQKKYRISKLMGLGIKCMMRVARR